MTSGCTARASTSTPTCTRWTSSGRACRRRSGPGWPAVLKHYGVTDLEPSPALEEAVYRVFLAQERAADQIPIVAGLLERWRNAVPGFTPEMRQAVGEVVERLVVATRLRYPVIGDLARSIRYEAYERPLIEDARDRRLRRGPRAPQRWRPSPARRNTPKRIQALVASPEPLIRLLAEQLTSSGPGQRAMLEAMTRRYYRVRELEDVKNFVADGRPYVTGDFELSGHRLYLISTIADLRRSPGGARRAGLQGREGARSVATWSPTSTCPGRTRRPTPIEVSAALRQALEGHASPGRRSAGHRHGVPDRSSRRCSSSPSGRPATGWPRSGSSATCTR